METLLTMSTTEINRLQVIQRIHEHRLTQAEAARTLGISVRQVQRLCAAYAAAGAAGVISKKRGRPAHNRIPDARRADTLALLRAHYPDFRPTFAAEKLAEQHGIHLSKETIRRWMTEDGLWLPRAQRLKRAHQPRYRRDCLGELIQIDGSPHAWFEERGPKCTLLVYIDDATSRLMTLRFAETESTFTYFEATQAYLRSHGKPVAFYSDKHSVFRTNKTGELGGDGVTQFGRALHDLNIDILCANTCQAKGRVERVNQTLQDRLVKELRLHRICTLSDANTYAPAFIQDYNRRFAKAPRSPRDLHRPLASHEDLVEIFCWQEARTVSKNLTLQYDKVLYLLEDSVEARKLAGLRVTVFDYPDGRVLIKHRGQALPYRIFDKLGHVDQGAVVDNKRLGRVLQLAQKKQAERDEQRSQSSPSRRHLGEASTTQVRGHRRRDSTPSG